MLGTWIADAVRQLVLAAAEATSQWFAGGERIVETAVLLLLLWITINRKDLSANRAYRRKAVVNAAQVLIHGSHRSNVAAQSARTYMPISASAAAVDAPLSDTTATLAVAQALQEDSRMGLAAAPASAAARAVSAMQQMLTSTMSPDPQETGGGIIPRGLSVPKLPTAASFSAAAVAAYSTTSSLLRLASTSASSSLGKEEFNRGLRSLSMTVTGASARMRAVMQEVSETTRIAGATLASSNAYYYNPLRPRRARRGGQEDEPVDEGIHEDFSSSSDGDSDMEEEAAAGWARYLAESAADGTCSSLRGSTGRTPVHSLAKLLEHIDIAAQLMDMMESVDIFSLSLASSESLSALSNDYAWERLWMLRYGPLWKSPVVRSLRLGRGVVWDPFHNWGPPQQGWKTFFVEFEYGWANWLLAGRNTRASCLIGLGNLILDATAFVPSHPGSSETLLDHAGGDCAVLVREMGHSNFAYRAMQHFIVFDGRKRSPDAQSYSANDILRVEQALRQRRDARVPLPGTAAPAGGLDGPPAGEEDLLLPADATAADGAAEYYFENEEEEDGSVTGSSHQSLREYTSAYLARPMCKLEVRLLLERLAVLRLCESDHRIFLRIMHCVIPKDVQSQTFDRKLCSLVPHVVGTGIVRDRLAFTSSSVIQKYPLSRISGRGSAAEEGAEAVEVAIIRAQRHTSHGGQKTGNEWVVVSDRVGVAIGSTVASATYNCTDFSSGEIWLHAAAAAEDPLPAAAADLLTDQKDARAGPIVTCYIDASSAQMTSMLHDEEDEDLSYWRDRSVSHLGQPRPFYDPLAQEWRVWWSCCGVKYTMDQKVIDRQCEK